MLFPRLLFNKQLVNNGPGLSPYNLSSASRSGGAALAQSLLLRRRRGLESNGKLLPRRVRPVDADGFKGRTSLASTSVCHGLLSSLHECRFQCDGNNSVVDVSYRTIGGVLCTNTKPRRESAGNWVDTQTDIDLAKAKRRFRRVWQSNYQCRSSQLSSSIFPKESICPYDLRGYLSTANIVYGRKKSKLLFRGGSIDGRVTLTWVYIALVNVEYLEGHDPHVSLDMFMNYYYCYYNESLISRSIQLFCEFIFELGTYLVKHVTLSVEMAIYFDVAKSFLKSSLISRRKCISIFCWKAI